MRKTSLFPLLLVALLSANTNIVLGAEKNSHSISKDRLVTVAQVNVCSISGHIPITIAQVDIINPIKLYVKAGLDLPVNNDDDFKSIFQAIRINAQKWNAIAVNFKQQSTDLDIYASKLTSTGNDIIQAIDKIPLVERVKQKVGDTNFQTSGINIPFKKDNGEIAYKLKELLGIIKKDIEKEKEKTAKVKTEIGNFREEIATKLEPDVNKETSIIKAQQGFIYELTNRFVESQGKFLGVTPDGKPMMGNKQPQRLSQFRWQFVPMGGGYYRLTHQFLGNGRALDTYSNSPNAPFMGNTDQVYSGQLWKITPMGGGYYRLTNSFLRDGRALDTYSNSPNAPFMGNTDQLYSGQLWKLPKPPDSVQKLSEIHLRLIEAEQAAEQLDFIWQTIDRNIQNSLEELTSINDSTTLDSMTLVSFKSIFERVINSWVTVKNNSQELKRLSDQAQASYQLMASVQNKEKTKCPWKKQLQTLHIGKSFRLITTNQGC